MDKSETYIKMCDTPEILQQRASNAGDFIYNRDAKKIGILPNDWYINSIWLPRQDDLQEMVRQLPSETYLVRKLYEETHEYSEHYKDMVYKPYYLQFKSMEQLWLAFVMRERYLKQWNGERWE